jgi:hypothetical protein
MLRYAPLEPGQKISGQTLRPPEDKRTIHQGKIFRQGGLTARERLERQNYQCFRYKLFKAYPLFAAGAATASARGKFESHQHGVFAIV